MLKSYAWSCFFLVLMSVYKQHCFTCEFVFNIGEALTNGLLASLTPCTLIYAYLRLSTLF